MSARRRASPYGIGRLIRWGTVSNGRISNSSRLPWTILKHLQSAAPQEGQQLLRMTCLQFTAILHEASLHLQTSSGSTLVSLPVRREAAPHLERYARGHTTLHSQSPATPFTSVLLAGRPFRAGLCAPILGSSLCAHSSRPLCAHSGHASARPSLGRSMCAHSGQASVRPVWAASVRSLWAGLDAPILGKSPCAQFGYAFGRPFWEAPARPFGTGFLCARSMGRPLCSHSGQASVRPFRQT